MNGLEVRKLIVVRVDANTEEQARVAAVNNLVVTELASQSSAPAILLLQKLFSLLLQDILTSTKLDWYFWSRGAIKR